MSPTIPRADSPPTAVDQSNDADIQISQSDDEIESASAVLDNVEIQNNQSDHEARVRADQSHVMVEDEISSIQSDPSSHDRDTVDACEDTLPYAMEMPEVHSNNENMTVSAENSGRNSLEIDGELSNSLADLPSMKFISPSVQQKDSVHIEGPLVTASFDDEDDDDDFVSPVVNMAALESEEDETTDNIDTAGNDFDLPSESDDEGISAIDCGNEGENMLLVNRKGDGDHESMTGDVERNEDESPVIGTSRLNGKITAVVDDERSDVCRIYEDETPRRKLNNALFTEIKDKEDMSGGEVEIGSDSDDFESAPGPSLRKRKLFDKFESPAKKSCRDESPLEVVVYSPKSAAGVHDLTDTQLESQLDSGSSSVKKSKARMLMEKFRAKKQKKFEKVIAI